MRGPKALAPLTQRRFYVTDKDWQDLQEFGVGNASAGLRAMLDITRQAASYNYKSLVPKVVYEQE